MKTFLTLLLLAVLFALLISPVVFEVGDNALIQAGSAFDGEPPVCRADRLGVVLTLRGVPSVCQQTPNGYHWTPAAQPARVAPSGLPQTAKDHQPCTQTQHGKLTGDGRWICVESGKQNGVFYWMPWQ